MQARKFLFTLGVVLATSASISSQSWARSTTTVVAKEKVAVSKEMAEHYAWPEGTLSLVNLPQRTIGWSLNISMQAADQTNFAFSTRDTADMQTIIDAFSAIKSKSLTILLDPTSARPQNAVMTPKIGHNITAIFALGSQKILDAWYLTLPVTPEGKRKLGQHLYEKPPTAVTPLLMLHVGRATVDLKQLKFPAHINLQSAVSDSYRKERPDDPVVTQIMKVTAEHKMQKITMRKE